MVMASKLCDSCKSGAAALFCQADSAFLCVSCDSDIHAANKLASRHARVWLCEVCEQAPAHVTCKADAAALCVSCDRDIHSANPLAQRHERVPVTPFYETVSAATVKFNAVGLNFLGHHDDDVASKEEAEAESWLLPNLKMAENLDLNTDRFVFPDVEAYLDLETFVPVNPKVEAQEQNSSGNDGVVPVQSKVFHDSLMNDDHCSFDIEFSKPFNYGYGASQFPSQSVSSSSLDFGVVPDCMNTAEVTAASQQQAVPLSSADREARVLRYREKKKNRKFEKTIRYASRKAYAETRPRIKGRFAKRSDLELERAFGYGVVPSF